MSMFWPAWSVSAAMATCRPCEARRSAVPQPRRCPSASTTSTRGPMRAAGDHVLDVDQAALGAGQRREHGPGARRDHDRLRRRRPDGVGIDLAPEPDVDPELAELAGQEPDDLE